MFPVAVVMSPDVVAMLPDAVRVPVALTFAEFIVMVPVEVMFPVFKLPALRAPVTLALPVLMLPALTVPAAVRLPAALILPFTSSFDPGVCVPIPTFPVAD
jgi:hypothetical protein